VDKYIEIEDDPESITLEYKAEKLAEDLKQWLLVKS
jgi:hypothetical protein